MKRFTAALATVALATVVTARAAEPVRIIFQGGRAIPIEALELKGANFVVTAAQDGLTVGQSVPSNTADHVFGDKPEGINKGIGFLLTGEPVKALGALEPIVTAHKVTGPVPGNFWVETARAAILAYADMGNAAKAEDLAKALADATPESGPDPVLGLARALLMSASTKLDARVAAFDEFINDNSPTDIAAYASYFKGQYLQKGKQDARALEAWSVVTCLYPTGGNILNGAAELASSQYLFNHKRRDEAVVLLEAAARDARNSPVADEAKKRLESMK
ncbi:hypothetical protein KBB96_04190 [Luteolibacter ambystomatis]|uniref:Tetratricopeptide repeat protein n=1 Tax=Luteolibacter ambystomatis TaxID=2824561 RepID=A0A975J138_9BACT|nr:hypothetical protein [Luteolibacter ambystomatis]QUE52093.1 hypothetical protein KBB96_04190 [Luteolibacter ambystomatis]